MSHPMWVRGLKHIRRVNVFASSKSHPMWVRGLKLLYTLLIVSLVNVAPYVGAWIETYEGQVEDFAHLSHPMWVRGLKQHIGRTCLWEPCVAPYVGAWIETTSPRNRCLSTHVAPYVGAWIETRKILAQHPNRQVAPYVGAWIETECKTMEELQKVCRTLCGCVD